MPRPGTVSKILWHFTGGPIWDDKKMKQSKALKPNDKAYEALKSILLSFELRVGNYAEIIRNTSRGKSSKSNSHNSGKGPLITIESSPVCCVADIPIQHLSYHAKRYGKMAIGFYRSSIIRAGLNPVLYTLENSQLNNAIVEGYLSHRCADAEGCKDTNDYEALFGELLAHTKTFSKVEFDSIYCEREWRSTKPFKFTDDDVAMVILPRKTRRNYFEEYVKDTKLLPKVPITCWEDLIEH